MKKSEGTINRKNEIKTGVDEIRGEKKKRRRDKRNKSKNRSRWKIIIVIIK